MQAHPQSVHPSRDGDALIQACQQEGCPVCQVTLKRMERVMDLWQYEGVSDDENRQLLVRLRGFCARHTWQLANMIQVPTTFALALVYRDTLPELLGEVQRDLAMVKARNWSEGRSLWRKIWYKWRRQPSWPEREPSFQHCPLCERQGEVERQLISELLILFAHEGLYPQLGQTTGFCLSHLAQAMRQATSDDQRAALLTCQYACLQQNLEEINELVRKHDYRFHQEPQGEEMTAWRRSAKLFVGNAGIR